MVTTSAPPAPSVAGMRTSAGSVANGENSTQQSAVVGLTDRAVSLSAGRFRNFKEIVAVVFYCIRETTRAATTRSRLCSGTIAN